MMKTILTLLLALSLMQYGFSQDVITVSVDFGGTPSELPWNNIESSQSGLVSELLNQQGQSTGISIEVTDPFNGTNMTGTQSPDMALEIPATATGDSFFGNAVEFSSKVEETGGVTISGLDPDKLYSLEIFASREATDTRETEYTITGFSSETRFLDASSNTNKTIKLSDLAPSVDGTLLITATTGPNNDNEFGFYYLGALKLSYEDELVVLDSLLVLNDPLGAEYWQEGKKPKIKWTSQNIETVILEYSVDDGMTWVEIVEASALAQSYTWTVPDINSEECLVRITSGHLQDQSTANFKLTNTDTSSCHIVVLGSSTAAGTGPTSKDSAWVWLYEDFIFQRDTRFDVTNLARGGFTTYNILPDESVIPDNLSFIIDTTRNISKALSLKPDALIINLPSNDAANSVPVEDQIFNYETILGEVKALEIPYWICTPQPRNGYSTSQQAIQNEMLDSTKTIFSENFIDFWTGLATEDDKVDEKYNSGDGVHLNNEGHKILLQRVLGIGIDSTLLNSKAGPSLTQKPALKYLELYPNPSTDFVNVKNIETPFRFNIYNPEGQLINSGFSNEGKIFLEQSGLQFIIIETGGEKYLGKILKQ